MGKQLPALTLVWMYEGLDRLLREEMLAALDYPEVQILTPGRNHSMADLSNRFSPQSEYCVFWADDDKPVGPDFLRKMVQPLLGEASERAAIHLWSGNALAVPISSVKTLSEGEFAMLGDSFMKLALLFLEVGSATEGTRARVEFSSTERLAPLCADPVGMVC